MPVYDVIFSALGRHGMSEAAFVPFDSWYYLDFPLSTRSLSTLAAAVAVFLSMAWRLRLRQLNQTYIAHTRSLKTQARHEYDVRDTVDTPLTYPRPAALATPRQVLLLCHTI